jgi:hypothetical protein
MASNNDDDIDIDNNNYDEDNIRDPDKTIQERLINPMDFNDNMMDYELQQALKLSMIEENKRLLKQKKVDAVQQKKDDVQRKKDEKKEEKILKKKMKEELIQKEKEEKKIQKENEKKEFLLHETEKRKNIFNNDFFKAISILNLSSNINDKDFYQYMVDKLNKYSECEINSIQLYKDHFVILQKVLMDYYENLVEKNKKPRISQDVYETLKIICVSL